MASLTELIKQAAIEAVGASNPTAFYFGTVTSTSPLIINVEQKMDLTEEFLILTRAVKDYEVEMTVDHKTDSVSLDANHSHNATVNSTVDGTCDVQIQNTVTPNTTKVESKATSTLDINADVDVDIDTRNINLSHSHSYSGKKKFTVHNGLKKGEKVILIRMQGGQQFVVLDRM